MSAAELRCLATTGMIGDVVKAVVGERGQVEVLMSSGLILHLYQPTRSDLAKVLAADVIFTMDFTLRVVWRGLCPPRSRAARSVRSPNNCRSNRSFMMAKIPKHDPHVWMDLRDGGWSCWPSATVVFSSTLPDGCV